MHLPHHGRQPVGAAGIPLPPGRSIAVDTGLNALGGLYFIEGVAPTLSGAFPAYRRTVMALDAVDADETVRHGGGAHLDLMTAQAIMAACVPQPNPG